MTTPSSLRLNSYAFPFFQTFLAKIPLWMPKSLESLFLEILGMFRGRILKLYILSAEFGLTQSTPDTYISCGV